MFLFPLNFIFLIIKLQLFQTTLPRGYSEAVCLYSHLLYISNCSEWSVMKMWFLYWVSWTDELMGSFIGECGRLVRQGFKGKEC